MPVIRMYDEEGNRLSHRSNLYPGHVSVLLRVKHVGAGSLTVTTSYLQVPEGTLLASFLLEEGLPAEEDRVKLLCGNKLFVKDSLNAKLQHKDSIEVSVNPLVRV